MRQTEVVFKDEPRSSPGCLAALDKCYYPLGLFHRLGSSVVVEGFLLLSSVCEDVTKFLDFIG